MTDFDDDCVGVMIEAPTNSLSVLDVDSMEVVHYDDATMHDTDDLGDADDDESDLPAMAASEDELDDPDVDADDIEDTGESDDAADKSNTNVDDVDDVRILGMDDASTKDSCNTIVAIAMFMIMSADIFVKPTTLA